MTRTGTREPVTELDARYSSASAPTPWAEGRALLAAAEVYWLTTVRPDGRPHVTPLIGVWVRDAAHFCTGPGERKARNLAHNPHCVLTTGRNDLGAGLDVVVEADAVRLRGHGDLTEVAEAYVAKYGEEWRFEVRDEAFWTPESGPALVFRVEPVTAFGFAKGDYGQTRWRCPAS